MHRKIGMRASHWRVGLAIGAALALQASLVSSAYAAIARTARGHVVSYQPTVAKVAAAKSLARSLGGRALAGHAGKAAPTAGTYKQCSKFEAACLTYFGGSVMKATTLTPIFWNPEGLGLKYPTGFESEIKQFFTDLAADSGVESNFFSLLTQYFDSGGHIGYAVTASSPIKDSGELPIADKCIDPFSLTRPCVTDAGVQAEIERLISEGGLPRGLDHEYVVFLPDEMDTCFGPGSGVPTDPECSGSGFCGYHTTLKPGAATGVQYANEPENGQYGEACTTKPGLKAGYVTLSSTSHEISESVTDPEPEEGKLSWYDLNEVEGSLFEESQYGEIGDMCAYEYEQGENAGSLYRQELSEPKGTSNQTINGHPYLLQTEWDNTHSTCSVSERASSTKASFNASASEVQTGVPVSVDASASFAPIDPHRPAAIASYTWSWGDGTQTTSASPVAEHAYASTQGAPSRAYTLTLTVTDTNGNTASASKGVTVGDRPPTASLTVPAALTAAAAATFDGSAASDPDGTIASYSWSFGDGSPAQAGATPSHTYAKAGTYTVTLTVADDAGQTASSSVAVAVGLPPNILGFGRVKQNKDGSLDVGVIVPYAGVLSARDGRAGILARFAAVLAAKAKGKGHKHHKRKPGAFVTPLSVALAAPGEAMLHLTPTAAAKRELAARHRLSVLVLYTFAPTGGNPASVKRGYTLAVPKPKSHKRKGHRRR